MFSKVVRQTHMYSALFLVPWMLMYALSTIVMNHREAFKEHYGGALVQWEREKEAPLALQFSSDATPRFMAEQILRDQHLDGAFGANLSKDGRKLTIIRTDPILPRRITYTPADGRLLVERQAFRTQPFLESLHRRRGFQTAFLLNDVWAITVDIVIVAMLFWVLSGLWMWWELKVTRWLGAVAALAGLALFGLLLFTI